jgi:nicotinate phosphoribosyltransferase
MTDFVRRITRPERDDWIIRYRTDTDFYTFTTGNFIDHYHPDVDVTFDFINRHGHIPYAQIIDEGELRAQLDHVRTLKYTKTEIFYLRGMDVYGKRMLREEYLDALKDSVAPPYELTWGKEQFTMQFPGTWRSSMEWELYGLPIVNELFVRTVMANMSEQDLRIMLGRAESKLYEKLRAIKSKPGLTVVDFGHRRRAMYLWQRHAIQMAMDILGSQFLEFGLEPKGTNSHQTQMVRAALANSDEELRMTPYRFLEDYGKLYTDKALRIMLPDTFGTRSFYRFMPKEMRKWVAEEWRGTRPDSGDLAHATEQYLHFLKSQDVNPMEDGNKKLTLPSDGNTVPFMLRFHEEYEKKIQCSFAWGTDFTNDLRGCHPRGDERAVIRGKRLHLTWDELLAPHSIVAKPTMANGRPCVKLSDNPNKATVPKDEVQRYLRVFGTEGRYDQVVSM